MHITPYFFHNSLMLTSPFSTTLLSPFSTILLFLIHVPYLNSLINTPLFISPYFLGHYLSAPSPYFLGLFLLSPKIHGHYSLLFNTSSTYFFIIPSCAPPHSLHFTRVLLTSHTSLLYPLMHIISF